MSEPLVNVYALTLSPLPEVNEILSIRYQRIQSDSPPLGEHPSGREESGTSIVPHDRGEPLAPR